MKEIDEIIKNTDESNQDKIDWTKAWSKEYPILKRYQKEVDIDKYKNIINKMLDGLKEEYGYDELDSFLVLKDIMYQEWKKESRINL